jgi:tRNA (guanine-N7-)-methyltransferase
MRHRYHPLAVHTVSTSPFVTKEIPASLKPLVVEVGCGKGQFLVTQALAHPATMFVGIEQSAQALYRAVVLAQESNLTNLLFMWGNVDDVFATLPQPIHTLYLLFSDPWPKVRHEKRRLTTPARLTMYVNHPVEQLILRTDNHEFFEYSLQTLQHSKFEVSQFGSQTYPTEATTEFEDKYRKLGKPIYRIEATR